MRFGISVLIVFICFAFAATDRAHAGLPENCIDRVESKSSQLIQSISSEINRRHSRLENHHGAVQRAWAEFATYFRGNWVRECLDTFPKHKDRYNKWLATNAQPVSDAAAAKLGEICSAYSTALISENKTKIEGLIERGATGEALSFARSFEGYLKRPIVAGCKPVKETIAEVSEEYIPEIRKRASLEGKSASFANRAFNIASVLRRAELAFASKGKAMVEAPSVLEGGQGRADFARSVDQCVSEAIELRGYGAEDDYLLTNRQSQQPKRLPPGVKWKTPEGPSSLTLHGVEAICQQTQKDIDSLFAKVEAHNTKYRAMRAKAWEKTNIKGSAMRRVYNENAKRWPRIERLGAQTVWTYRSYTSGALTHECKEYVFTRSGSLKNRRTRLCN